MNVHVVVLAGGSGTRFWPASREARPKQLLPFGAGAPPLLTATLQRLRTVAPPRQTYVVTAARLAEATAAAAPGLPKDHLLAEPAPRNTAAAIGWATHVVARHDPKGLVAVFPSDQHVGDEGRFQGVLQQALAAAGTGALTTVGIVPTRPETGYGYIELGEALPGGTISRVARFVEKPPKDVAEAYVAGGRHLWNAGMFFFRADVMLDALRQHLPELASGLVELEKAATGGRGAEALAEIFPRLPSVSIDTGVFEKAQGVVVVPGIFGWSDVGSWESVWELATKDGDGNVAPEGSVFVDAQRNLVFDATTTKDGARRYALVGVEDLVLVETDDAVLVLPRHRSQDVRAVVDVLKQRGEGRHL